MGCTPPPPPRCVRLASLLCALLGTSGLAQAACTGTALGIADACVWLRADTGVSASRDWADQSGMSNTATVNGTIAMTTLNFNPAVSYSNRAGHTFAPAADVTNRYTFLGVARMADLVRVGPVFANDLGASLFGIDGGYQDRWLSGSSIYNLEGEYHRNSVSLTPSMHTLRRDGAAVSLRNNGETIFSTNINLAGAYRMTFAKGGVWGARYYSHVSIPEFLSFKRPLSDAELARVHSYLALKYGLTLGGLTLDAAQQPYVSGAATPVTVWDGATDYRYRVSGLGRDSVTTLDQRVAKSQEPGALLTIAAPKNDNSADFTSANNDSSRLALSDGKYLVLGDNNGALNTFSADALGQRGNRITRVWRVQNTLGIGGTTVNAVFLGFDPTLLPASLATSGYLLVSSDANFSAATTTRYPLNRVNLGGQDFLTPVIEEGSNTPGVVNMLRGVSYISLGQSSPQVCTGSAIGITDACLWLKADAGVSESRDWADQSGMSNTATVNGTTAMTTLNFNPAVSYSDRAGHTFAPAADVTNRYTFLGVARMADLAQAGPVFANALSASLFGIDGGYQDRWRGEPSADNPGGEYHRHSVSLTPSMHTLRRDDAAVSLRSNGEMLFNNTGISFAGAYRMTFAKGGVWGPRYYSHVSIPEFLSFKRPLSDAELARAHSYLALKYGLTLGGLTLGAAQQPYVSGAATPVTVWDGATGYPNRVFGLGRDSVTTLDQRVAKSQEPGAPLTIAALKNDNSANFTSANNDSSRRALQPGQYLVLGDNDGALNTLSADALGQRGNRIPRVWRVQNTPEREVWTRVNAVFLGFDPTLLPASLATSGYLLVSSDANFSAATTTRYPLNRVKLGDEFFLTPVIEEGSSTPGVVNMLPGVSYISLGQSSPQVCTGSAIGIANACVWLRADTGVSASRDWADQSGMSNTATVNGTTAMTTLNFNPAVSYSDRAGHTFAPAADVTNRYTFLGVARMADLAQAGPVFADDLGASLFGIDGGYQDRWRSGSSIDNLEGEYHRNSVSLTPSMHTLQRDRAAVSLRNNGETIFSTNINLAGAYRMTFAKGGVWGARYYSHVSIPEFLSFKRPLSDAELARAHSYLALKYGLTLGGLTLDAAQQPYVSGAATPVTVWDGATDYRYRVFGLGRDSVTTLDQRVSRSTQKIGTGDLWVQQGDSPLTIATSADFTSANGGTRRQLEPGQYLVLGDNNGALDALSASAMGRNNNRLPRVWRAQNTGVRSVFLGLDAATLTLSDFDSRYPRYLFVESGAGADGSFPADRTHAYALSNLGGYWVPVAVGAPLAVNIPNDGAYLSYGTLTEPQLSLTVQSRGGTGTFGFSGTNGFVASSATTRAEMQPVAADPATQTLSAPDVDIVITVTMPAATGWRLEAASCIDRRAAASGNPSGAVLGGVSASDKFTIPAAQAKASADLHCALIARYDLGSTLKTVSGRVFIDNGAGGGVANDGHINGGETGRSGAALSLTNCGSGSTTIYAYTSSSGDGRYSLKVPPTAPTNGPMCIAQTLIDDYRVTQGGLDASGADATGVTLDTTAAQRNRWRFNYAGANVQNLHIGNVPSSRLLVDGTRVGIAGSTVDFPHRLIAGTAGTLAFGVSDASPAASGWSEVLYRDFNCNAQLDAGEPLLGGSPTVEANENVCVIVRQFVPAGLYEGATRQFQLQATLNWANAAPRSETLTNRDHTQVSGQALRLYKEVRNVTADERSGSGRESWTTSNSAKPGETLEYRTTFTNLAPEPITRLEIYDATPNYTTLVSAECPAPLSLPAGLTCEPLSSTASPPTKPIDGGTGPLRWRFNGPLPGGTSGAVKYRVKVNE